MKWEDGNKNAQVDEQLWQVRKNLYLDIIIFTIFSIIQDDWDDDDANDTFMQQLMQQIEK